MKKKRVSVGIAPDDLKIGDFVAVIQPKQQPTAQIVMGQDEDGDPIMIRHTRNDRTSAGVPHRVLGVSWPWIVFGVLLPGGDMDGPIIHDLRRVKCMRLGEAFVNAIIGFKVPKNEIEGKIDLPSIE